MKQSGHPRKPGKRGKTRYKYSKRDAKVSVNDVVQEFSVGDKVAVVADASWHSGLPHKSFHGLTGEVSGKRGSGYIIDVMKGEQLLQVVTTPPHMKKLLATPPAIGGSWGLKGMQPSSSKRKN